MSFVKGNTSIAVIMITLNEAHNLEEAINQLQNWASEIFVVDSFSTDKTIEILNKYEVIYKQRKFTNFGDQWNFALKVFNIKSKFTMKLDPDERLTNKLKERVTHNLKNKIYTGYSFDRVLFFMGKELPISQEVVRIWQTGKARFTDVLVNETPIIEGKVFKLNGKLLHMDSPDLHHWYSKQNQYSTSEALAKLRKLDLPFEPKLFGNKDNKRMWFKKYFSHIPGRFILLFLYYYLFRGLFRAGKEGFIWSHLRSEVMRMREYKYYELKKKKNIFL
jgi:glycosyltransferase involved in cell wall biosynthesis